MFSERYGLLFKKKKSDFSAWYCALKVLSGSVDIDECFSYPYKNGALALTNRVITTADAWIHLKGNEDWGTGVKGEEKQS